MQAEVKKLHLIEELLKINSEYALNEIEKTLAKLKAAPSEKISFKNFTGTIDKADLDQIKLDIENGCEQINNNDWK